MNNLLLAAISGAIVVSVFVGGLSLYYLLQRCERRAVWSDDATLAGKARVHYKYAMIHNHHREWIHVIVRAALIGLVAGGVLYIFGVGLIEVAG